MTTRKKRAFGESVQEQPAEAGETPAYTARVARGGEAKRRHSRSKTPQRRPGPEED